MTLMRAGSAMIAGVPNSATVSRNTTIAPPMIAGSTRGRVMRKIVRVPLAPRMLAASSISEETRSSASEVNTKM